MPGMMRGPIVCRYDERTFVCRYDERNSCMPGMMRGPIVRQLR